MKNEAVTKAYKDGTYTDSKGREWRRGMDGWFLDIGDHVLLARHDDMVDMIVKENPDEPE